MNLNELLNILLTRYPEGRVGCYTPDNLFAKFREMGVKLTKIQITWLYYELNERRKLCFFRYPYSRSPYIVCPFCKKEIGWFKAKVRELRKELREHLEKHLCYKYP